MIEYDFSWIDDELKRRRSEIEPGSPNSKLTDIELIETFTYPHDIFFYIMPIPGETSFARDKGDNDFLGDEQNYLKQLINYISKYRLT